MTTKDELCRAWKPRVLGVALTDLGQRGDGFKSPQRDTRAAERRWGIWAPPTAAHRTVNPPGGSKRDDKGVASSQHKSGVRRWGTWRGTSPTATIGQVIEIYREIHISV